MEHTNQIRKLLDEQNALEWKIINLEQMEHAIINDMLNWNIDSEEQIILLKTIDLINKKIFKAEYLIDKNKMKAENYL